MTKDLEPGICLLKPSQYPTFVLNLGYLGAGTTQFKTKNNPRAAYPALLTHKRESSARARHTWQEWYHGALLVLVWAPTGSIGARTGPRCGGTNESHEDLLLDRARDLIIHGPAHRGANGAAIPTDEDDQDGHFFFNHPERGGNCAA